MTDVAADAVDLTALHLDVYDTRTGPWNPEHGDIEVPDDWEFLPRGDAFVTRTVKTAGRYWLCWQPRGQHHTHRRLSLDQGNSEGNSEGNSVGKRR